MKKKLLIICEIIFLFCLFENIYAFELNYKDNPSDSSDSGYIQNSEFSYDELIYKESIIKKDSKLFRNNTLPVTYDLRNIDDVSYAPQVRDQGDLGLCWAFSLNSMTESYLIRHNMGNYNFSENKYDLALNSLATSGFFGSNFVHALGDGGNNFYSMALLWAGIGPTTETNFGYDYMDSYSESFLNSVSKASFMDASYNDYDITDMFTYYYNTSVFGNNPLNYTESLNTNVIEPVKTYIMANGAISSATFVPSNFSNGNTTFIYNKGVDVTNNTAVENYADSGYDGHAITIIGWDDNYGDIDNADGDNDITTGGDGAWLVQNSWGDFLTYFYISYYDVFVSYDFTQIVHLEEKTYDNQYINYLDFTEDSTSKEADYLFYVGTTETVDKVKLFLEYSVPRNISVTISSYFGTCESNETKTLSNGLYSFTFDNCLIYGETTITINNGYYGNSEYLNVLLTTNNIFEPSSDAIYGYISDSDGYIGKYINNYANTYMYYNIYTKTIDSFTDYNITILGTNSLSEIESANNITNNFTINKMDIWNGESSFEISFKNEINDYKYIIIYWGNNATEIRYFELYQLDGSGIESDPYLIKEPEDLDTLSYSSSYFKLNNNIDMKNITSSTYGLYNDEGYGWQSLVFSGVLNGNGYSIKNLYSKDSWYGDGGLFKDLNGAKIYNLKLENFNITNPNESVACLSSNTTDNVIIDNVEIYNCNLDSSHYSSGLIANVEGNLSVTNVKLYDSTIVSSDKSSGLIGIIDMNNNYNVEVSNNYLENNKIYYINTGEDHYSNLLINDIDVYNAFDDLGSISITNNKVLKGTNVSNATNATNLIENAIGEIYDRNGTLSNSNEVFESIYTNSDNAILTSEESIVSTTFADFDFSDIWDIDTNETPRLKMFDLPTGLVTPSVSEISENYNELDAVVDTSSTDTFISIPIDTSISNLSLGFTLGDNSLTLKTYNADGSLSKETDTVTTGTKVVVSNGYDELTYNVVLLGDLNCDGEVSLQDFRKASIYILGNTSERKEILPGEEQVLAADINGDKSFNVQDFRKISNYILGESF